MGESDVYWPGRLVVFIVIIGRVARPGFLIFFSRAGDLFSNLVHSPFEKRLLVFRASSKQRFG